VQDGLKHLTGQGFTYTDVDLNFMFAHRRPVVVRVAGDPTAGGTAYVDHWGPDPSGLITWQGKQATAILVDVRRSQQMNDTARDATGVAITFPVHFLDLDFLLLTDPVPAP
jgi:hypothetical protein